MAHLSQVNRKFRDLNKNDLYWKMQFDRNWSKKAPCINYHQITITLMYCNLLKLTSLRQLTEKNALERFLKKTAKSNHLASQRISLLLFIRQNKVLDEETRDRLLGYYYIILDESAQSLFSSPHLILVPGKVIGWICYKIHPNLTIESAKGLATNFAPEYDGNPAVAILPHILVST
mgnify:CR=1 FL=1